MTVSANILGAESSAPCTDRCTAVRVYLYYGRKVVLPVPTEVLLLGYICTMVGK